MSIEANLMNNDCTSLDGWDVTDVDVSGGGFHFPRYSDIYMVGPLIPYAGNTATIEFRISYVDSSDRYGSAFIWAMNASTGVGLQFLNGTDDKYGLYYGNTETKLSDISFDGTTYTFRVEYDGANGEFTVYMDNVSLGTYPLMGNILATPVLGWNTNSPDYEFYVYPNIKIGDGLGDFGGEPTNKKVMILKV
jgi:hypothetical protein